MVNVVYTLAERAVGRGVKVEGVSANSPLANAVFRALNGQTARGIQSGDILLEVDGRKLHAPEELLAALSQADSSPARIKIYRAEWTGIYETPRGALLDGATTVERLGIVSWSRGRDWRASGFYGHYVTYAEVLQLIASLAFGLLIALERKRSKAGALLFVAIIGLGLALLLTVTRASQLGFLISASVIVLVGVRSRRTVLLLAACALPLVLAGLFVLQQKRQVGFFDVNDGSISWRETVWREGFHLLVSKPRHLLVGVGMDSVKQYGCQWGLFDNCKLPTGHMHSTPLQFALERGVPALLAWLILVLIYTRMLWRLARSPAVGGWIERGLALGALGGLCGFFASGLVHYNFGDSEVVMVFYFIMGLCLALERQLRFQS
jgi:O-antigen ligase